MPKKDDEFVARMNAADVSVNESDGRIYACDWSPATLGDYRKSPRTAVRSLVREMEKRVKEIKEAMGDE